MLLGNPPNHRSLTERNQVRLTSLLQSPNGRGLEPQVGLEILSNLTDETLEGEFPDEEFGGFLSARQGRRGGGTRPSEEGGSAHYQRGTKMPSPTTHLVFPDLPQSDRPGLVPVRLLDSSGRRSGLSSGLGGELFSVRGRVGSGGEGSARESGVKTGR